MRGALRDAEAEAVVEPVPKRHPLLLDEDTEALNRAVVGVEEDHRERHNLRSAVPAVRAVDKNTVNEKPDRKCVGRMILIQVEQERTVNARD